MDWLKIKSPASQAAIISDCKKKLYPWSCLDSGPSALVPVQPKKDRPKLGDTLLSHCWAALLYEGDPRRREPRIVVPTRLQRRNLLCCFWSMTPGHCDLILQPNFIDSTLNGPWPILLRRVMTRTPQSRVNWQIPQDTSSNKKRLESNTESICYSSVQCHLKV